MNRAFLKRLVEWFAMAWFLFEDVILRSYLYLYRMTSSNVAAQLLANLYGVQPPAAGYSHIARLTMAYPPPVTQVKRSIVAPANLVSDTASRTL